MADDDQQTEKTEEPSQRRIKEAVERGQVVFSREVTNFLIFVVFALLISWMSPYIMHTTADRMVRYIESPDDIRIDERTFGTLCMRLMGDLFMIVMPPAILVIVVVVGSALLQHGFNISWEPVMPKLEKISLMKGIKRLFSMRSVVELIKGIIKISVIGIVSYMVVMPQLVRMDQMTSYDMQAILMFLGTMSFRVVLGACIVMGFIAALDYLYQRYEYLKSLRMTRQELKEEFKQTEGDPTVKARLRQIRMERARKRMMTAVPKADVVITNPTHFAIALKYDQGTMVAPVVVAKGQDLIALQIRKIAEEHKVPVVENKPLARALFDAVELDKEIPIEFYQAVAEVIGYVYRLKGKQAGKAA
ncbi:MAG: flagellar biosynthesis protein FlhB [Proteobacteria bacterium]|nr:flagellar biosynthesis protein FlhB [Pseudomonadota bacterium]